MIYAKDFETVVDLVRALPDEYRQQAAMLLTVLLKRAEEEMTMTPDEIEALRDLERKRRARLYQEIAEVLDRWNRRSKERP